MNEMIVHGDTLPDAYHEALCWLKTYGLNVPCPDYNTEQKELSMTIVVNHPTKEPRISRCFIGGPADLQQYVREMLDGILDFEVEKGNWKYTYHKRMVSFEGLDQIQYVITELKRNPDSRRACITLRTPEDLYSDDPACLQHIQYFIREGELHCKVLFRSNDACKATFMNAFALVCLQERIAQALGVKVGSYTHRANSFHCYKADYDKLEVYVRHIREHRDLFYNYAGDWDEQMAEANADIDKKIKVLRGCAE